MVPNLPEKLVLSMVVFGLALALSAGTSHAADCGGDVACTCGDTLNESRTLNASDNLTGCPGDGLEINGTGITLDCAGYVINGSGGSNGVKINYSSDNAVVNNCTIHSFGTGIYGDASLGMNLTYNTIYNLSDYNGAGIFIADASESRGVSANITNNNITSEKGSGIFCSVGNANVINNSIIGYDYGIESGFGGNWGEIKGNNITAIYNSSGSVVFINSGSPNITENNITGGYDGIYLYTSGSPKVWHNNIYGQSNYKVNSPYAIELSLNNEGNYWGRTSCPTFIEGTDSNDVNVVDSYAYNVSDGWLTGDPADCLGCGDNVTDSATLTYDLTSCSGHGLVIAADNVTLDCAGYTISGDYNGSYEYGVFIQTEAAGSRTNVTVKNCIIYGFDGLFSSGISTYTAYGNPEKYNDTKIINNTIYDNNIGINAYMAGGINWLIENNNVTNSTDEGIIINKNDSTVINNSVESSQYGIFAGYGNNITIIDNIVNNSRYQYGGGNGIHLSFDGDVYVYNNTVTNSEYDGIHITGAKTGNVTVSGNDVYDNSRYGLNIERVENNSIWHNNIYNNTNKQVYANNEIELSYNNEGNFWGRTSCSVFVPKTDSNAINVTDSYAYNATSGWLTTSPADCPQCYCDSCSSCTDKLNDASCDITYLTDNIMSAGSCITGVTSFTNKAFDCQDHIILGSGTNYSSQGIYVSDDNNNTIIRNCDIEFFGDGIFIGNSSYLAPVNSNVSVIDNTFRANLVRAIAITASENCTITGNYFGPNNIYTIELGAYSVNNNISYNNFEGNIKLDIWLNDPGSQLICNNIIQNNTGDGGRDIIFANTNGFTLKDEELAQLILCDADGSNITNVTVDGSDYGKRANGVFLHYTSNSNLSYITSSNNYQGLYIRESNNNNFSDMTIINNLRDPIHLYASVNNEFTDCVSMENDEELGDVREFETSGSSGFNTVKNLQIDDNLFVSFEIYKDIDVLKSVANPGSIPSGYSHIGKFVKTVKGAGASISLNISYSPGDISQDETKLTMWRYNSSNQWELVNGSGVNTSENYLYSGNTTEFGTFAIFEPASASEPPDDDDGSGGGGTWITPAGTVQESHSWYKITPENVSIMKVNNYDIGIHEISISVTNQANYVYVRVTKLGGKPASITQNLSGKVYHYMEIFSRNLEQNLERATIRFSINKTWMESNNINPDTVKLYRFSTFWEELPTTYVTQSDTEMIFEAVTTGFSCFAVSAEEAAAAPPSPCNNNGICDSGETAENCPGDCTPPQECTPGTRECMNQALRECSSGGDQWNVLEVCEFGCSEAACLSAPEDQSWLWWLGGGLVAAAAFIIAALFIMGRKRKSSLRGSKTSPAVSAPGSEV